MEKALGGEAEGYVGWRRVSPQCFIPGFCGNFGSNGQFEGFQRPMGANEGGIENILF